MTTTLTIDELEQSGERELGTSSWHEITQEQVNGFADATGDHQWIHVDPERAAAGPFGTTIAHGYLTLSLLPLLLREVFSVEGARIRGGAELVEVEDTKDGAVQAKIRVTVEIEGGERPACVVDTISRYYPK